MMKINSEADREELEFMYEEHYDKIKGYVLIGISVAALLIYTIVISC